MPSLIAEYGVLIVVAIIFLGEIGIPTLIPGEIAILVAGSQVIHSVPELIGVWVLFGVVDVLACTSIHTASRTHGNRLLLRLLRFVQPNQERAEETVDGWRRRLGGRDALVVFVTRMIPMFRLYASVTTGLIRVRFRAFLMGAAPASFLWAAIPLTLGYAMRNRLRLMEAQYPQLTHYVILASASVFITLGIVFWVKAGENKKAAFRRLRFLFGAAAVLGTLTRLVLVAIYGDRTLNSHFLAPSVSALSVWVTCLSLVAFGLMWIAARDLRIIRRYHPAHGISLFRAGAWVSLMAVYCALNTVGVVAHPAVLG